MKSLDLFADLGLGPRRIDERVARRLLTATAPVVSLLMAARARYSRRRLVREGGPVVSLTSFGERAKHVSSTVESIGRGRLRPSRLIVWLDDPETFPELAGRLDNQVARGLEVRLTENYGPHTKYYPLVKEEVAVTEFVTADDDIIYPKWWLSRLMKAASETPDQVVCHRAHRIQLRSNGIDAYENWSAVLTTGADPTVFATGVSGVYYPPGMASAIRKAGAAFLETCRSADDVWLHNVALRAGIPVRQIANVPRHFWITNDSQSVALMDSNLAGGNDAAVAAVYSESDIAKMRDALREDGN